MSTFIKVNNTEYPVTVTGNYRDNDWNFRKTKTLFLELSYAEVLALLPAGTPWSIVERDTIYKTDENGALTGETEEIVSEIDCSEYSLSGNIIDHRNGTVSIKMGKPTTAEDSSATVVALVGEPVTLMRAMALRPVIETATVNLSDDEAAKSPELITRWADHIGETVAPGDRRSDEDADGVLRVYKVREGKGHTTQKSWPPHLTPDMWVVVDVAHAGTQDDPIPASRGMEYEYGKYYLDSEDGKTYKCERIGEAAGGKIVLQYLPHELVGNYFTVA